MKHKRPTTFYGRMRRRLAKRFGLRLEKAIVAYDKDGNIAHVFPSVIQVCQWTGLDIRLPKSPRLRTSRQ